MKRLFLSTCAVSLLVAALALSGSQAPKGDLDIRLEERNPWTGLQVNNDPATFHFAVVSDRTGGHRARVFSQAVEQINMLQPAFVLSVGDLIEGYSKDPKTLAKQWNEFQGYVQKLQMPFFYVPGNHDLSNAVESKEWESRFGRRYYHFVYKDVLFMMMCTDDPHEKADDPRMSKEQIAWADKTLKDNAAVRWTVVALHKPIWAHKNLDKNGWLEVEKALAGRSYTVFAGHVHHYQKFVRNGMNYYQLATTGGSSKMRGLAYAEFDHIAWVTIKKEGLVMANLLLDGIYSEAMQIPVTSEDAVVRYNRKPTYPVKGTVLFEGAPAAGAKVVIHLIDTKKTTLTGDALAGVDGTFTMSTYQANDGAPAGEYAVTITQRVPPVDATGKPGRNRLPAKYASAQTTDLKVEVKAGENDFTLNLVK